VALNPKETEETGKKVIRKGQSRRKKLRQTRKNRAHSANMTLRGAGSFQGACDFASLMGYRSDRVVRKLCVESDGVFFASIGLCGSLSSQSLLSLSGLRQTRRKAFGRRDHFYSPSERQNHRLLGTILLPFLFRVERHQRLSSTDKPSIDLDIVRQVSLKRKRRLEAKKTPSDSTQSFRTTRSLL
jgi:hypothetical protein